MKGLLKDKFEHVEMPVSEYVWTNVSAQIGVKAATVAGTSTLSIFKVIGIAVASLAVVGATTWLVLKPGSKPEIAVVTQSDAQEKKVDPSGDHNPTFNPDRQSLPTIAVPENGNERLQANPAAQKGQEKSKTSEGAQSGTNDPPKEPIPFPRPVDEITKKIPKSNAFFRIDEKKGQVSFEPIEDVELTHYHWSFGDGQESHDESPTHVYEEPGNYNVTLTVTDEQGSSVSSAQEVAIEGTGVLQVVNIITPNGDGYNDTFDPAGMDESVEITYLLVLDLHGRTVFESTTETRWDGNLSSGEIAPAGTYIYLIRGKDKNNGIIEKSSKLTVKR